MKLTENFTLEEFKCKDGSGVPDKYISNIIDLANYLQTIRNEIQEPLHIISGYRTPSWNKKVGGAEKSQHLYGKAADITTKNLKPKQLKKLILKLIKEEKIKDGGLGLYAGWVHYDIGNSRRWNG